jgi:hypothetical protein
MAAIKLTRDAVALVDDNDYEALSKYKWYCSTKGYAVRDVIVNGKKRSIRMHRIIGGAMCKQQIDHINHDKLDNRKANLRVCTNQQNQFNSPPQANSTSSYKGVHWNALLGKWRARIIKDNKPKHLGCFELENDAAIAYNKAAKELYGEFAYINNITNWR